MRDAEFGRKYDMKMVDASCKCTIRSTIFIFNDRILRGDGESIESMKISLFSSTFLSPSALPWYKTFLLKRDFKLDTQKRNAEPSISTRVDNRNDYS